MAVATGEAKREAARVVGRGALPKGGQNEKTTVQDCVGYAGPVIEGQGGLLSGRLAQAEPTQGKETPSRLGLGSQVQLKSGRGPGTTGEEAERSFGPSSATPAFIGFG